MSIQVTIDGLDYDVDVTMIDSPSDIDPETYMALRGLKGDKGDDGSAGADGSDGSDGADGVGITSITQNLDGTLTITLDDGTSYDTDPVKGEKGDTGDTGNGIASVVKTATSGLVDTYTITYTDGTTATFDITNGKDGQDGQDGHSPSVTASKVGDTTTIYVDGTAIGTIDDGVDGQNGQNGQDGHSPVVTASKSGKVTTVYVDGSSIATINDGNDGERGTDGDDGFSPVATVSKSGDTATISITDKNGTTTATVTDGVDGDDAKQGMLFFGQVDSTSTSVAFTAQIDGITEYYDGLTIMLKNGVVTSASGFTLNINGLGAKHAYSNMSAATAETTLFNINYTMMFTYDSTRVEGGGWILYRGYNSDNNTIGYQLRTNSMTLPMKSITYRYRLLFTSADGEHFVPANNSTSTNATSSRTVCQDAIDPFGDIRYYGTTASVAANSRPSATNWWQQYGITLGYSFNRTGAALTLTSWKPVYVKCAPQSDGSAIIDSTTPYVQDLPTTEDGKIYIYLGVAYSATQVELVPNHPVYWYKDGQIRPYTNASGVTSVNGQTGAVTITVPTKTSDLRNDGNGTSSFITSAALASLGYITGGDAQEIAEDILLNAQMVATDATSKAVLAQAFGFDADIVIPSDITSPMALLYKLEPRTWFCWMNGTEMEFARLSVSVNTSNSAITLYLRGRTSIATGIMGVDSSWTMTQLASDAEGVAY